jgi:hypothetical protein
MRSESSTNVVLGIISANLFAIAYLSFLIFVQQLKELEFCFKDFSKSTVLLPKTVVSHIYIMYIFSGLKEPGNTIFQTFKHISLDFSIVISRRMPI